MPASDTVTLATLKRGKNWKQFFGGEYVEFKRNVPKPVTEELALELEDLVELIGTEDDNSIEVDRFTIERNVPVSRLEEEAEQTTRQRTRMVTETVPLRKPPSLRKVPKINAVKKPGFGRRTQAAE